MSSGHCRVLIQAVLCAVLISFASAQEQSSVGLPIDWSSRRILHSNKLAADAATNGDPRAVYDWLLRNRGEKKAAAATKAGKPTAVAKKSKAAVKVDWSFPLGGGTVPVSMFPAKYSFDAGSSTPSCTSDYLVYALNVAGSSTQPNVVRFNNIYAGTGGLCGTAPTVLSAYNINTLDNGGANPLNGVVETSPALSLDGKKLAFIETVTGNTRTCPGLGSNSTCSIFHVLTWGITGNNGTWDGTNLVYAAVAPGTGNDASVTTLTYSSGTTTFSSPWIDYRPNPAGDNAYFGDDTGKLYKTTCVFYCSGAPALAAGWPVTVAAGVKLGPPVYDTASNKVFVGGSNGNLYSVDLTLCPGATCTGSGIKSVVVGSANTFGGVLDAPLVDQTFQTVFAFAGDNGSGKGVVAQTNTGFTLGPIKFNMGSSPFFNIYTGAVDNAYYNNTLGGLTVSGNIFACGQLGGSGQPDLYWAPFTKGLGTLSTANPPVLNTAGSAVKNVNIPGNPGVGCTPLTEFQNGATDRLFFSQSSLPANKCVTGSAANDGCMMMYNITTPSSTIGASPNAAAEENLGTSAIIVDNASASAQASSIYFANQGTASCTTGTGGAVTPAYCAVKLTQSALQ